MAETEHSAAAAQEPQAERELMVSLRPHGLGFWEFEGTRAQLEAEGVIPAATEWPATGAAGVEGGAAEVQSAPSAPARSEGADAVVGQW